MNWTCTLTEERLSDYLDGALLPEEQAAFSGHAASCATCAQMLAQVSGLVARLQQLSPIEEPPRLVARILAGTLGAREQGRGRWFEWLPLIWQPRFAMGLATVAASLIIVFHAVGIRATELTTADLNPATLVRAVNRQAHLGYARGVKFVNDLRVVYEIESRLQWQPQPAATEPANEPAAQPESNPPAASPRQKSQEIPSRREARGGTELAFLLTDVGSESVSNSSSRSAR